MSGSFHSMLPAVAACCATWGITSRPRYRAVQDKEVS
jgi:hypothetical protein